MGHFYTFWLKLLTLLFNPVCSCGVFLIECVKKNQIPFMKWESLFIWNDDINKCFFSTIHDISLRALFVPCTLYIVNRNFKKGHDLLFNITYTSNTKIHQERTICLVMYLSYYKQNKSSKNQTMNFLQKS